MEDKTIIIENQKVTFSGLIFKTWFGILVVTTLIVICLAGLRYLYLAGE